MQPAPPRTFLRRKLIDPITGLLRRGVTPQRLAWSLAVGFVVGVNPLLGSTTVCALAAAYLLGLNLVASQIISHLVYPLELLLFPAFIRLGDLLFRTSPLPLTLEGLVAAARTHPWQTTRLLWFWEWHALVIWALFTVVAAPAIALSLKPALVRTQARLKRREARRAVRQTSHC